jgi:hypothetical protein
MERIDGAPIAPVDQPRRLLDLAIQIADGLAAAHAAGVVSSRPQARQHPRHPRRPREDPRLRPRPFKA